MLDTTLSGANLIDRRPSACGSEQLRAQNRMDGSSLDPVFVCATHDEVREAAQVASRAFGEYGSTPSDQRAEFLDEIARQLEGIGDIIVARAHSESALSVARLNGELGRTCNQLRMFASLVREGSWVDARIDTASSVKPDIRRMLVPLGPVAVFGASNFPLAFSVAGGDTASALAAGCPVVVKGHPSHLGTSELAAKAIIAAAAVTGMPTGVFALLHGGGDVGRMIVLRPEIEAVAFTGSQSVGRALFDLGASREKPIPVFAEMGSVNPVFMLPGAIDDRGEALAVGYADSLTLGVGQFCTNPGVVVGLAGRSFDAFLRGVESRLAETAPGVMLNEGIARNYACGLRNWSGDSRLHPIHTPSPSDDRASAAIFAISGADFLASADLREELFGPAAIAVQCESLAEMRSVAKALDGQLTATVHYADSDMDELARVLPVLVSIAGRVLANGFPTGVEVCSAMQHGGPYPATTDSRSTSVGTAAILRFVRPVAFQNIPDGLLPPELQEANPLGIRRLVDGVRGVGG